MLARERSSHRPRATEQRPYFRPLPSAVHNHLLNGFYTLSAVSPPLPTPVRAFILVAKILQPFLPRGSTRIEMRANFKVYVNSHRNSRQFQGVCVWLVHSSSRRSKHDAQCNSQTRIVGPHTINKYTKEYSSSKSSTAVANAGTSSERLRSPFSTRRTRDIKETPTQRGALYQQ